MWNFTQVELYLNKVTESRTIEKDDEIKAYLKEVKADAVKVNDQEVAKLVWCSEKILSIQNTYISAFNLMKQGEFYNAWCNLERVEIALNSLDRHFAQPKEDVYRIKFIEKHTKRFQSLFPYKYFLSPGMLYLEKKCSICNAVVSLRKSCGHKKGEIYNGEMCVHIITDVQPLEFSIVTNPVQKYSVLFITDQESDSKSDHYDYGVVKYVINGLKTPFDAWNFIKTTRYHPHELFSHVKGDENCPCDSGKKYKDCCLKNPEGVLRPHIEFFFSSPPPKNLPATIYPNYK